MQREQDGLNSGKIAQVCYLLAATLSGGGVLLAGLGFFPALGTGLLIVSGLCLVFGLVLLSGFTLEWSESTNTTRVSTGVSMKERIVPYVGLVFVVVMAATLMVVIGRGPYTHGNLLNTLPADYVRTGIATIPVADLDAMVSQLPPFTYPSSEETTRVVKAATARSVPPARPAPSDFTVGSGQLASSMPLSMVNMELAAKGKEIFTQSCIPCHGATRDHIPTAKLYDAGWLQKQGDGTLTTIITNGKGGMPAWGKAKGGILSDDDIKAVLAYLKAAAGQ